MTKAVWGARATLAGVLLFVLFSTSCGDLTRQGQSSSYLIIRSLAAASGAEESELEATLFSDVLTVVDGVPTIFGDPGRVEFALGMKDPGSTTSPSQPTSANFITVDRYHVKFIRADGRNAQGVDVPYEFDGGVTLTVSGESSIGFTLVRHQAKVEAPLAALVSNGQLISTIAEVTFYGHDQTGRAVSVTGRIDVNFGNFGDPE